MAGIDAALVARLIAAQFPQWAGLPVRPVQAGGHDNRTFHLGPDLLVRLPSAAGYAAAVAKEQAILPRLAPHLPLPIPVPLAQGRPGEGYPWDWSVYRWLPGETLLARGETDLVGLARDLGGFLTALHRIGTESGPLAGAHSFHRGGDLAVYGADTRLYLDALDGMIDAAAARRIWEEALAERWTAPPVWVHGDVAPGNLLVSGGVLSGVIDFGTCAVGDPACDLAIAWTTFDEPARVAFAGHLALDAATWRRGQGWALWKALFLLHTAPGLGEVAAARRTLAALMAGSPVR
jgi:aminoglycoside phosphotransferase (APT) family kinase protein